MSNVEPGDVVTSIMDGMAKFAETINVVSDPVQVGDKVVIPAVVVRMGFGAGGGGGKPAREESEGKGTGAGGGGGLFLTPVFLIVDSEGERLLTIPGSGLGLGSLVEQIKAVVERFSSRGAGEETETEEG